jgi:Coenzyme PQQ synthesis protein D (PqqD)
MKKEQTLLFTHRPGLDTRLVELDAFIITRTTIKHLNSTAAIIWLMLEAPTTRHEVLQVLRKTFPAVSWQRLSADLGKVLNELLQSNLIRPISPTRRSGNRNQQPSRGMGPKS